MKTTQSPLWRGALGALLVLGTVGTVGLARPAEAAAQPGCASVHLTPSRIEDVAVDPSSTFATWNGTPVAGRLYETVVVTYHVHLPPRWSLSAFFGYQLDDGTAMSGALGAEELNEPRWWTDGKWVVLTDGETFALPYHGLHATHIEYLLSIPRGQAAQHPAITAQQTSYESYRVACPAPAHHAAPSISARIQANLRARCVDQSVACMDANMYAEAALGPLGCAIGTHACVQASALHAVPELTWAPPKAGYQIMAVRVQIHNYGEQTVSVSKFDFRLRGAGDKVRYSYSLLDTGGLATELPEVEVDAGGTIAGDLAFEVPTTAQHYDLLWTSSDGLDVQAPWVG